MQLLKVDEWQSPSGKWYVADVKTWTNWEIMAEVLEKEDLEGFKQLLNDKYKATIHKFIEYRNKSSLLIFSFDNYKDAHQLKLDINRIARKKNFLVEKAF